MGIDLYFMFFFYFNCYCLFCFCNCNGIYDCFGVVLLLNCKWKVLFGKRVKCLKWEVLVNSNCMCIVGLYDVLDVIKKYLLLYYIVECKEFGINCK